MRFPETSATFFAFVFLIGLLAVLTAGLLPGLPPKRRADRVPALPPATPGRARVPLPNPAFAALRGAALLPGAVFRPAAFAAVLAVRDRASAFGIPQKTVLACRRPCQRFFSCDHHPAQTAVKLARLFLNVPVLPPTIRR